MTVPKSRSQKIIKSSILNLYIPRGFLRNKSQFQEMNVNETFIIIVFVQIGIFFFIRLVHVALYHSFVYMEYPVLLHIYLHYLHFKWYDDETVRLCAFKNS